MVSGWRLTAKYGGKAVVKHIGRVKDRARFKLVLGFVDDLDQFDLEPQTWDLHPDSSEVPLESLASDG